MQFRFDSFADFITMSGHGPYIWACYTALLIALVTIVLKPIMKTRSVRLEIKHQQQIAQRRAEQKNKA